MPSEDPSKPVPGLLSGLRRTTADMGLTGGAAMKDCGKQCSYIQLGWKEFAPDFKRGGLAGRPGKSGYRVVAGSAKEGVDAVWHRCRPPVDGCQYEYSMLDATCLRGSVECQQRRRVRPWLVTGEWWFLGKVGEDQAAGESVGVLMPHRV